MSEQDNTFSLRRLFGSLRHATPGTAMPLDERARGHPPVRINGEDGLDSETLRRLWRLLDPKRGARKFLRRADIDPGEMVYALPYVALIEVHPQLRFRHRLVGTGFRDAFGFEATDTWIEDWPNNHQRGLIVRGYVATVEARQAIAVQGEIAGTTPLLRYEVLLLPLSADDEAVGMIFLAAALLPESASA